jgi:hypothetical protein
MAQDIERQAPNIGILILSRTSKAGSSATV